MSYTIYVKCFIIEWGGRGGCLIQLLICTPVSQFVFPPPTIAATQEKMEELKVQELQLAQEWRETYFRMRKNGIKMK